MTESEAILLSAEETQLLKDAARLAGTTHVVVCLNEMAAHTNGSPIFSVKVYGPFTEYEVEEKAKELRWLEGGAILVRPLVDLAETYRRLSAD